MLLDPNPEVQRALRVAARWLARANPQQRKAFIELTVVENLGAHLDKLIEEADKDGKARGI